LRAADTKIKNLESLAQCLELEQLDISSTNVEDISFVENLKHLKFLDISDSPVGDLSPAVRILEHQLTDASPSLFNLKYGNCELLTTPPLEVVAQGDEGVLKYFKAIKMRGKKEGLEVKILLVGESMAGKTSLCVRLLDGPDSPLPTTPERTIGLRVLTKKLPLNLSNNKVVQVNIFDFGGHSFYKPLHHFFYSKRALYIFVTKNGDDSNQYDYWFEIIKLFGGSSTVFLLHNLFSGIPCGFNPNLYANKYSYNIQTDLLKCNNLQEIKTQLTDAVEKMPLINSTYPAIWFDIKQDIEERRVTSETIPLSDLLGKYGQGSTTGMSNEEIIACLEYLHEVGTCLFYKDIPGLDKTVILNHDWAIKAVFQVLMDKKVIEGRGKFTLDDIKRIWSSEPQEGNKKISPKFHEHWYGLLELMRDFYLCFEVILNGKVFIAPELLGIRQNDQVFDWQPSDTDLILKIDYSFLPFGFFSRFISLNYKRIENDSYWKDEVILRWGNSRAHVTCNQKTIIFEIQGNDLNARRHLFEVLKSTLDDLHTESADLNPDVLVPCVCEYCVSKSPFDRHFFKLSELTKRTLNKKNTIECPIEPGYCNVIVVNILEQIEVKNQILSNKKPRPLKAFVSYSKKDIESLGHLKKHLSALVTAGSIELWDDSQIPPGEKWDDSIKSAIEEAKIIFVLLSADLLDNEYVWKEEIPHAMRRHKMGDAIIIPIKLRACNWDATELSKIQGLPFKDTYIQNEEERIRDQIWLEVVKGIEKIIVRFRRK